MKGNKVSVFLDELIKVRGSLEDGVFARLLEAHTQAVENAVDKARVQDPLKCQFGHPVLSHRTAEGWCCACDADIAFMEGRIRDAGGLVRE